MARHLEQNPPNVSREAVVRCQVSRIYYAAFGKAARYAEDFLGFRPTGRPEDHGRLKQLFISQRRHKVGVDLGRLREIRNQCDYAHSSIADPEAMLKDAGKIYEYVIKALPPPSQKT